MIAAARCEVCLKLNAFDDLSIDCDEADDEVVNGSCPWLVLPPATPTPTPMVMPTPTANSVAERNSYGRSRPGFGRGVVVSSVALVAGLAGLALRRWISGQGAVADRRWRFR